jgi:hypothetical protein
VVKNISTDHNHHFFVPSNLEQSLPEERQGEKGSDDGEREIIKRGWGRWEEGKKGNTKEIRRRKGGG